MTQFMTQLLCFLFVAGLVGFIMYVIPLLDTRDDYAAFTRTMSYWLKRIETARTRQELDIVKHHIDKSADQFKQYVDHNLVATKVAYLKALIEMRENQLPDPDEEINLFDYSPAQVG